VLSHPLSLSLSHTNTFKGRGEPYILTKERERGFELFAPERATVVDIARAVSTIFYLPRIMQRERERDSAR
jgi:hypothetical protein